MVAFTKPRHTVKRFRASNHRDGVHHSYVYETSLARAHETILQICFDAADADHPLDWTAAEDLHNQITKAVVKSLVLVRLRRLLKK